MNKDKGKIVLPSAEEVLIESVEIAENTNPEIKANEQAFCRISGMY